MPEKIKLAPPANTKTVKVSFVILEEEMKRLEEYVRCYNETYGVDVKPQDLLPQIIEYFLNSDRGYRAWRGRRGSRKARPRTAASANGSESYAGGNSGDR